MKVLVTGGAGFIGSHVVEALARRGDAAVVLDSFDAYYDLARKRRTAAALARLPGVQVVEGDVRDAVAVDRALAGVDAMVHLAARPGVRASMDDPKTTLDVNVNGLLVLLEALRGGGPKALVSASSSSVYGGATGRPLALVRRPPAAGDMPRTEADLTRARVRLGFEARVPLEEGLRRTTAWRQELRLGEEPLA